MERANAVFAKRWSIAFMIAVAIAISYLDRQTLPWAIKNIQVDIPIGNQTKAFLDSAFLATYGLMYLGRRLAPRSHRHATRLPHHHDLLVAGLRQPRAGGWRDRARGKPVAARRG